MNPCLKSVHPYWSKKNYVDLYSARGKYKTKNPLKTWLLGSIEVTNDKGSTVNQIDWANDSMKPK